MSTLETNPKSRKRRLVYDDNPSMSPGDESGKPPAEIFSVQHEQDDDRHGRRAGEERRMPTRFPGQILPPGQRPPPLQEIFALRLFVCLIRSPSHKPMIRQGFADGQVA